MSSTRCRENVAERFTPRRTARAFASAGSVMAVGLVSVLGLIGRLRAANPMDAYASSFAIINR
jgi:hypothetical protein